MHSLGQAFLMRWDKRHHASLLSSEKTGALDL